jgi:hypothetical protein
MSKVKGPHCYNCEKPLDTKAKLDAAKYVYPLPEAKDLHSGGLACDVCAPGEIEKLVAAGRLVLA